MTARTLTAAGRAGIRSSRRAGDGTSLVLAAAAGALCGLSVTQEQQLFSTTGWSAVLLAMMLLAYLAVTLSIRPELLFSFWLFAAPFLQNSAQETGIGLGLARVTYLAPPVILLLVLMIRGFSRPLRGIDYLPALFLGYVLLSAGLASSHADGLGSQLRPIYETVGIGIIAYYFLAFGPAARKLEHRFCAALIASGCAVAAMSIVDGLTGWNLWHDTEWQVGGPFAGGGASRAAATLGPPVLGTFLGMVFAFALAILLWGPRSLKRLSKIFVLLALPGMYFTYTRGPMLAMAGVAVAMILIANRSRWQSIWVLVGVFAALLALGGAITSTSIFQSRFENTSNIRTRVVLQQASFTLAERRPIAGWGHGSFDTVKTEANLTSADPAELAFNTSHNTFLTVLVELGILGLALLLVPWAGISLRSLAAARRHATERWLFAGVVGALIVYVISACTYDTRFFSFISVLPWAALGLARRTLAKRDLDSKPQSR